MEKIIVMGGCYNILNKGTSVPDGDGDGSHRSRSWHLCAGFSIGSDKLTGLPSAVFLPDLGPGA